MSQFAEESQTTAADRPSQDRVPKICGADVELGNFLRGAESPQGTSSVASRLLLRQVHGIAQNNWSSWGWGYGRSHTSYADEFNAEDSWGSGGGGYDPQDWGRKFLACNGGCVYIDLNHLELCIPEVTSARDFVSAWHAMLRIARGAQHAANALLKRQYRIEVLVNNSDGLGSSYGSHLSFLLSRRTWDAIFIRKLHYLLYLASFQASSIVVTGQGKVGAENDAPEVDYQLSQRADFFEAITGLQTTYRRPLVNSRDEALCGTPSYVYSSQDGSRWRQRSKLARLHVIFYDSNLCHVACLLKVGMMQIVLAMLEEGQIRPELILDDPLDAIIRFSHDPTLQSKARTAAGQRLTAVEMQLRFLEEAQRFYERGGCEGVVPGAQQILALQADTLGKLRRGELDALVGRLDWVLKLRALEHAMARWKKQHATARRPELTWHSPEMKHMDHLYASLDPHGLYWAYEKDGLVERVVEEQDIDRMVRQPPADTRAYTRAMLLRQAGPERVQHVDWDSVEFKGTSGSTGWPLHRTVKLSHPAGMGHNETGHLFTVGRSLDEILDELTADAVGGYVSETTWTPTTNQAYQQGAALLPAPEHTSTGGSSPLAVYDCGSWQEDHPKAKGETDGNS